MYISQHFFGQHEGHLRDQANDIAKEFGAWHVNYTDPCTGKKRGWFATPTLNGANPQDVEQNVMRKVRAIGGFKALQGWSSSEARPTNLLKRAQAIALEVE